MKNIKASHDLKSIIETEKYDLIHCHTAMGSVVARLAARNFRNKGLLRVIYTVHGFHFFKGSPVLYWLLYYPMELYLSRFTDAIISINNEDYELLVGGRFKNKETYKISGIGLDLKRFTGISRDKRADYRIKNNYEQKIFIVIYIAEFIERKNHKFIVDSISPLAERGINLKVIFAGRGILKSEVEQYSRSLGDAQYIDFLGFRSDIGELIAMSDLGVSVSRQEGLGMNLVEIMYCGVPVVATNIRGHNELVENGYNGYLFDQGDTATFTNYIYKLYSDKKLYLELSANAKVKADCYELSKSIEQMSKIYQNFLN